MPDLPEVRAKRRSRVVGVIFTMAATAIPMRMNLLESELRLNSFWLRAQAAAQLTLTIPSKANGPCTCQRNTSGSRMKVQQFLGPGILLSAERRPDPRIYGAEWARRVAACVCLLIFREANDGGPVDDRTISSGRTRMFSMTSSLASLRRRSSASVAPISCSGWRTVVSGGYAMLAYSISSKPKTETPSGTLWPASRNAVMALRAEMSL